MLVFNTYETNKASSKKMFLLHSSEGIGIPTQIKRYLWIGTPKEDKQTKGYLRLTINRVTLVCAQRGQKGDAKMMCK